MEVIAIPKIIVGCQHCNSGKQLLLIGAKPSYVSKRAIYNFIPKKRHAKARFIGDCQSPTDLYDDV